MENSLDSKAGQMKKGKRSLSLFVGIVLLCTTDATSWAAKNKITMDNADLVGAGATFPAPLYQRWIKEFMKIRNEFSIFYDAVGSGEGIQRFMAEKVAFGGSDAAMTNEQMAKVQRGVQLIPATAGIIVLVYHIPNVPSGLRLSREVYTDIFLGKIRYWNDNRILELNPNLELPKLGIVTVTRSDSSGTTWAFTNHLSTVSDQWRNKGPGVGKKVDWPGNSMASRYNEGVAARVRRSWGGIGYVEYGVAKRAGLPMAVLENKSGQYIAPSDTSGTATLANASARLPSNLRMFIPDPDGEDSYPIVTYSWLLIYKSYPNTTQGQWVKQFVNWGLNKGQTFAAEYGYSPLPESVVQSALNALSGVR
jgi:phosphate transport system substrate-binding protein